MKLAHVRVVCLLYLVAVLHADPTLPALFGDHMVLQRDQPIVVWGWAKAGEAVSITLASRNGEAKADSSGHWRVELPALTAGGPFTMQVSSKAGRLFFHDVMVGEVWLCSGQSNMAFGLQRANGASEDIAASANPRLRLFTVPTKSSLEPLDRVEGGPWRIASPDTAKDFSAVAYYFGRELQRKLEVPVGIIHSSWSGTQAESWTDSASLRSKASLIPIAERWQKLPAETKESAAGRRALALDFDDFEFVRPDGSAVLLSNFENASTGNTLGGEWSFDCTPAGWFELVAEQPKDNWFGRITASLSASDGALLRADFGQSGRGVDLSPYEALRFRARSVGAFKLHILQPSIIDWDNYATGALSAEGSWQTVTVRFADLKQAGWGRKRAFTLNEVSGIVIEALRSAEPLPLPPSSLYNAMIAPVAPYGLRGFAWYQGEGNAGRSEQYRDLLPAMIEGWRRTWSSPEAPFLIVQLANFGPRHDQPSQSGWAELREAQFMTARRIPKTGLAVAIDIGDGADVHPTEKREVGRRLALWALGTTYHQPGEYSGPLYRSSDIEGGSVRIRFDHAAKLASRGGGSLKGFAIAAADRKFVWAEAKIDGDSVVVSSPSVPNPVAVRYAWDDDPECNLVNAEGLPASPFRTDDWPGVTAGLR